MFLTSLLDRFNVPHTPSIHSLYSTRQDKCGNSCLQRKISCTLQTLCILAILHFAILPSYPNTISAYPWLVSSSHWPYDILIDSDIMWVYKLRSKINIILIYLNMPFEEFDLNNFVRILCKSWYKRRDLLNIALHAVLYRVILLLCKVLLYNFTYFTHNMKEAFFMNFITTINSKIFN